MSRIARDRQAIDNSPSTNTTHLYIPITKQEFDQLRPLLRQRGYDLSDNLRASLPDGSDGNASMPSSSHQEGTQNVQEPPSPAMTEISQNLIQSNLPPVPGRPMPLARSHTEYFAPLEDGELFMQLHQVVYGPDAPIDIPAQPIAFEDPNRNLPSLTGEANQRETNVTAWVNQTRSEEMLAADNHDSRAQSLSREGSLAPSDFSAPYSDDDMVEEPIPQFEPNHEDYPLYSEPATPTRHQHAQLEERSQLGDIQRTGSSVVDFERRGAPLRPESTILVDVNGKEVDPELQARHRGEGPTTWKHQYQQAGPSSSSQVTTQRHEADVMTVQRFPVPHFNPTYGVSSANTITFSYRSRLGVPLGHVESLQMDNEKERMLGNRIQQDLIRIVIDWPGYQLWTKLIKIGEETTRVGLATEIASAMVDWYDTHCLQTIQPRFETWAVKPDMFLLEHIYLTAIRPAPSADAVHNWVVDFEVENGALQS